ncbi:MAG: hypothetical protein JW808_09365 [Victivallales bacterium]|nr:hypothetical protein [Victivallales bacterium]
MDRKLSIPTPMPMEREEIKRLTVPGFAKASVFALPWQDAAAGTVYGAARGRGPGSSRPRHSCMAGAGRPCPTEDAEGGTTSAHE